MMQHTKAKNPITSPYSSQKSFIASRKPLPINHSGHFRTICYRISPDHGHSLTWRECRAVAQPTPAKWFRGHSQNQSRGTRRC